MDGTVIFPYLVALCMLRHDLMALLLAWRMARRGTWIWSYLLPSNAWRMGRMRTDIGHRASWLTRL